MGRVLYASWWLRGIEVPPGCQSYVVLDVTMIRRSAGARGRPWLREFNKRVFVRVMCHVRALVRYTRPWTFSRSTHLVARLYRTILAEAPTW